jgi:hypothetical protein
MTLTDNEQTTNCLKKAKVIQSEIKEIIGLSYPIKESDYLTIQCGKCDKPKPKKDE